MISVQLDNLHQATLYAYAINIKNELNSTIQEQKKNRVKMFKSFHFYNKRFILIYNLYRLFSKKQYQTA